jgi:plastocyanin
MRGLIFRVAAVLTLVGAVTGLVAPPARAVSERVTMAEMRFDPARLEVAVGDMVVWTAGDDDHTVTARDGTFDSSPRGLMGQGDEFRWRFRVPGEYTYYCRVHGSRGMQGVILVVDPFAPSTTPTRPTSATAPATTSSTAGAPTTVTAAPTTTTTARPLATSSTTTVPPVVGAAPAGQPAVPQEAPALNPAAPVLGSAPEAGFPTSKTAARRSGGSHLTPVVAAGVGAVLLLGVAGGTLVRRRRRSA